MASKECHHEIDDTSHDLCRSHAFCARGYLSYAAPCAVCEELWERSRDISDAEDSMLAFQALQEWVKGFRKNSRRRPKGESYFFDENEKSRYQDLLAIHHNLGDIQGLDMTPLDTREVS